MRYVWGAQNEICATRERVTAYAMRGSPIDGTAVRGVRVRGVRETTPYPFSVSANTSHTELRFW